MPTTAPTAADTSPFQTIGDTEILPPVVATEPAVDPGSGEAIPPLRRLISLVLLELDPQRYRRPRQVLAGLHTDRQFERVLGRVLKTTEGEGIRLRRVPDGFAIDRIDDVRRPARATRIATVHHPL